MSEISGSIPITLWDSDTEPPQGAGSVYTWNGYAEDAFTRSLWCYVETRGERLRDKFLTWTHDLGESRIDEKRLIDHFAFEDGLSYWWMTLFVEQCPLGSPSINDIIRLLALEEIIVERKPGKFRLASASRNLHEVLSGLCRNLGIAYEWEKLPLRPRRSLKPRDIYRALPPSLRAIVSLARYLCIRWPLRKADKSDWFGGDQSLFFCSYFDNIDFMAAEQGRFQSYYWTGLQTLLNRIGYRSNWLQLFIPCNVVPTSREALSFVRLFNKKKNEGGFHSFLDAHLSWRIGLRVLKRWLKLASMSRRLGGNMRAFRPQGSQLSLWPIIRREWNASLCGPVAISNLLSIELFDAALREIPCQKIGLYLCENQRWERAFIHAWRKHGHGRLIAVQHAVIRFWDLRYFTDSRAIRSLDKHPMPQADCIALNGRAAIDAYLSVDCPIESIVECEALRYGYLNDLRPGSSLIKTKSDVIRVLVLGDYIPVDTIKMLRMLEMAAPLISAQTTYTVKPHPNFPIKAADFPSLPLTVVTSPPGGIPRNFDIGYAGNLTSAAIDLYLAGIPVVVMLNDLTLNLSPLRRRSGVRFVSTPEELAEAFRTACQSPDGDSDRNNFFFLDPELPRWSHLLTS